MRLSFVSLVWLALSVTACQPASAPSDLPDSSTRCGTGTTLAGGFCVPLSGDADPTPSDAAQPTDPTAPPPTGVPQINLVDATRAVAAGTVGALTFNTDIDADYQLERGGQSLDAGVLFDAGHTAAFAARNLTWDSAGLALGHHALRLYAWTRRDDATRVAMVEVPVEVYGTARVLVWHGYDNPATGALVGQTLTVDPRVAAVAFRAMEVVNPSPPSLAELNTYDAVVFVWSGSSELYTAASLGNALADYVDGGGALVYWGTYGAYHLSGRLLASEYTPTRPPSITPVSATNSRASATLNAVASSHPLLANVSNIGLSNRPVYAVAEGAEVIATWNDGLPLVAVKGAVAALGWDLVANATDLSGNWEELLGNTVAFTIERARNSAE